MGRLITFGWGLGALLLLLAGIALHVVIRVFAGRRTPPATSVTPAQP